MKGKELYKSEADLCDAFIATLREIGGWTIYPETAGFDIIAVWDRTGHQLGVEAKLKLNAKVADQILPSEYTGSMDKGPDFRAVIVPELTDASHGIARMLRILGVLVLVPDARHGRGMSFEGALDATWNKQTQFTQYDTTNGALESWKGPAWHDWNPAERCQLPEIVPLVRAGVPAPLQLTPWKIGALKVLAELELAGYVTARVVREFGVDPRRFCASDGWLVSKGEGRWARGSLPAFEQQHPEAYAQVLADLRTKREVAKP